MRTRLQFTHKENHSTYFCTFIKNNDMNKIAIITGASRGIGKSISLGLAEKGYKCLLIARSESDLRKRSEEIQKKYPQSPVPETYICDFLQSNQIKNTLKKITSTYKNIDILVNNAGVYKSGSIEHELEDFKDLLEVNLSAPFLFLKAIAPVMKKQGYGYIFNIASRAAKIGFEGSGFYSSSKFALLGLSESLYRELTKFNIKITAICPSYVNTEMAFEAGAQITAEEMIQTEDISNTLDYLLKLSKNAHVREVVIECGKTIV